MKSCTVFAVQADGTELMTVEGLEQDGKLHPLQEGFMAEHGLQCGYCTPGMLMTSYAFLKKHPTPTEDEIRWAISGNLCRCTGYVNIVKAVQHAAAKLAKEARDGAQDLARSRRHGALDQAEGRPALHPRQGHLRRRRPAARDALPGHRAQPLRPREDQEDRHARRRWPIPGVLAVITGQDLAKYNLHWMPTLMSDTQMVLPVEKVMYQAQEVAAVLATSRYAAADGAAAVEVEYEPLPVVVDPKKALEPGAPVLRTDKKDKKDNHIWHWEWGDKGATDRAFGEAAVTVKEDIYLPRIHVASIETCGCIAHFDKVDGKLTVWMTTQAPHAIRTVFALVAGHVGLAEHKIRIISPDIGGGFGGKVPVYPGYVIAVAASVLTGKPVKWIEDRMENLQADSFARDYHITAELAAKKDGTLTALRIKTIADHGYTDAAANPSKFPAGLFHVCTGSYDLKTAHVEVDGVYTNKPPGGIAYRCSFRVTEAVHTIERMVDLMAHQLGVDPAEFRMKNFIKPEQFPYKSALGWEYDSGNYAGALKKAMDTIGYADLRREQAEKRTARSAHGHRHLELHRDRRRRPVQALRHPRPQDVRQLRDPDPPDRQGHRAVRHEVAGAGPRDDLRSDPRRGAGHSRRRHPGRGGRHRHRARTAWARTPAARRRSPAPPRRSRPARCATRRRKIAAYLLEVAEDDLVWEPGKFSVKGAPGKSKTIQDIAFAAYTNHPQGMEAGLEAVSYYDPPNLTYPFGSYICVVDIDSGTGRGEGPPVRRHRRLRQHHQPDDRAGPGPRRPDHGAGAGALRGNLLRRDRQHPRRQLHRLSRAHGGRDAEVGDRAIRSRRRPTIRSAPRASANRPPSARRPRSRTRWSTRSGIWACATSTSRSRPRRCGSCSARRA